MPITHSQSGSTIYTGEGITYFRMCTLKAAVGLELKGIRVRRGPLVWPQVKREFKITGTKQAVYDWLVAKVEELATQQIHVTE